MKKIEKEFLNDYSEAIHTTKSFKDISNKINTSRFINEKKIIFKLSYLKYVCLGLLFVFIVPIMIYLFVPRVVEINIINHNDLVTVYEKNASFIDEGIIVEKRMSNGEIIIAESSEFVVDSSSFVEETEGNYYIPVYLKNRPSVKTGYYVKVVKDNIVDLELVDYRDVYYQGEIITNDDIVLKKKLDNDTSRLTKYIEYTIDVSNFNNERIGIYNIEVVLNSNKNFKINYQVEVKELEDLNLDGRYGYIDTYYQNFPPTILGLEIINNKAYSNYADIIIGDNDAILTKEIINGEIVIRDNKHSQTMIYDPYKGTLSVKGLMISDPNMDLFRLDNDDYIVKLSDNYPSNGEKFVAINGYLDNDTISHLNYLYGGICLDYELTNPIDQNTRFNSDTIIYVGVKMDENMSKEFIGTWYDRKNSVMLRIENDRLFLSSDNKSYSYTSQLIGDEFYIRINPYIEIYRYNKANDKITIYDNTGYYLGELYRFNKDKQAIVTVKFGTSKQNLFVINKGEVFSSNIISRSKVEFITLTNYDNSPIEKDITLNASTSSTFNLLDICNDTYGTIDNFFIIRNSWSCGKDFINNEITYWYEEFFNNSIYDSGWVEIVGVNERVLTIELHSDLKENRLITYNLRNKTFSIENKDYVYNKTPFDELNIDGTYYSNNGYKIILTEDGLFSKVVSTSNNISYQYIFVSSIEEERIVLWYTYQNIKDEREVKYLELLKVNDSYEIVLENEKYLKE